MPDETVTPETIPMNEEESIASKSDVQALSKKLDAVLDAVKELTTVISDLHKENVKWFRAGKMGGV